jgi:hypothetical protein
VADPLGKLFFPLKSLKLSSAFIAGEHTLDVKVSRGISGYSSKFLKDGTEIQLSLEKTDQNSFSRALLEYYYFRTPEKKYTTTRKFFARMGFHNKKPLEMEYSDQKYKYKFKADIGGRMRQMQMFYSPVIGRMVVRAL